MHEVIYYNGNILTMDEQFTRVDTMSVCDGKIVALGNKDALRLHVSSDAIWIDLGGYSIVPGFIDAHCHFLIGAFAPLWIDCSSGKLNQLSQAAGGWVRGRQLPQWFRYPSLDEFDSLTSDRPTIAIEPGYHNCALNSAARRLLSVGPSGEHFQALLKLPETLGMGSLTRHPPKVTRPGPDSSAVQERAMGWAENISRDWFQEHYQNELLLNIEQRARQFLEYGVTCVCDAAVTPNMARLLMQAQKTDHLPFSVVMLCVGVHGFFEPPWDRLGGPCTGEGNERLLVGPLKLFVDGGRQSYVTLPDGETYGVAFYNYEQLVQIMTSALQRGFSLACHAMGNAAIALLLRAYASAEELAARERRLLRIEHAALLTPSLIQKMAEQQVIGVVQPHWISWLGRRWLEAPYPHLRFLPFRSLLEAGVMLAGSSDVTDGAVVSPLASMAAAVSRQVTNERVLDQDQALTPREALVMFTRNAALACGVLNDRGTLEIGKRADFVVLTGDPLNQELLTGDHIQVALTCVEGRPVYTHPAASFLHHT